MPTQYEQVGSIQSVPQQSGQVDSTQWTLPQGVQAGSTQYMEQDGNVYYQQVLPQQGEQVNTTQLVPQQGEQVNTTQLVPQQYEQANSTQLVPQQGEQVNTTQLVPTQYQQVGSIQSVPQQYEQADTKQYVVQDLPMYIIQLLRARGIQIGYTQYQTQDGQVGSTQYVIQNGNVYYQKDFSQEEWQRYTAHLTLAQGIRVGYTQYVIQNGNVYYQKNFSPKEWQEYITYLTRPQSIQASPAQNLLPQGEQTRLLQGKGTKINGQAKTKTQKGKKAKKKSDWLNISGDALHLLNNDEMLNFIRNWKADFKKNPKPYMGIKEIIFHFDMDEKFNQKFSAAVDALNKAVNEAINKEEKKQQDIKVKNSLNELHLFNMDDMKAFVNYFTAHKKDKRLEIRYTGIKTIVIDFNVNSEEDKKFKEEFLNTVSKLNKVRNTPIKIIENKVSDSQELDLSSENIKKLFSEINSNGKITILIDLTSESLKNIMAKGAVKPKKLFINNSSRFFTTVLRAVGKNFRYGYDGGYDDIEIILPNDIEFSIFHDISTTDESGLPHKLGLVKKIKIADSSEDSPHDLGKINISSLNSLFPNLESFDFGKNNKLKIKDSMFEGCSNLKSVTNLPSNLYEIPYHAFYNSGIESIDIPDSVEKFGSEAFARCGKLKEVLLPKKLCYIGEKCFEENFSLEKVAPKPSSKQGVGSTVAPNSNTNMFFHLKICESAFLRCHGLKTLELPTNTTHIGEYAFYRCQNLINITIPALVKYIGRHAFAVADKKDNVVLVFADRGENDCELKIESGAFYGCNFSKDNEIIIPNKVSFPGNQAVVFGNYDGSTISGSFTIPYSVGERKACNIFGVNHNNAKKAEAMRQNLTGRWQSYSNINLGSSTKAMIGGGASKLMLTSSESSSSTTTSTSTHNQLTTTSRGGSSAVTGRGGYNQLTTTSRGGSSAVTGRGGYNQLTTTSRGGSSAITGRGGYNQLTTTSRGGSSAVTGRGGYNQLTTTSRGGSSAVTGRGSYGQLTTTSRGSSSAVVSSGGYNQLTTTNARGNISAVLEFNTGNNNKVLLLKFRD